MAQRDEIGRYRNINQARFDMWKSGGMAVLFGALTVADVALSIAEVPLEVIPFIGQVLAAVSLPIEGGFALTTGLIAAREGYKWNRARRAVRAFKGL